MKNAKTYQVVLVTAPDLRSARQLATAVLAVRAAACVNLVPKLESHYWWQGKLATTQETLMLIKTTRAKLPALEKIILTNHPYDTPEIVSLSMDQATERYLKWIAGEVKG